MARRPKGPTLGAYRARVVRGPSQSDPRPYWRIEHGRNETAWAGRATSEEIADELARLHREAPNPAEEEERATTVDTLERLMATWLGAQLARTDIAATTQRLYRVRKREVVGTMADPTPLGARPVSEVTANDVEQWAHGAMRRTKGRLSSKTIHNAAICLHAAWRWGRRAGLHDREDLAPRLPIQRNERDRHTPTVEDMQAVLAEMPEGWPRLVMLTIMGTGARIGEVADIVVEDVSVDPPQITVGGKTGRRTIPVAPELVAELAPPLGGTGRLWSQTRDTIRTRLKVYLERACTEAKVRRFTPHAMRRAAVDALALGDVEVGVAAAIMGHSPTTMLQHYRTVRESDKRAAVDRVRLGGVGKPT